MCDDVVLQHVDQRGVATLTLNRPSVNNACNGDMINALLALTDELANDDAVRMVVLRGNGPHFQAGADLTWINSVREQGPEQNIAVARATAQAVRGLNEFPKPTMALVHETCAVGQLDRVAAPSIDALLISAPGAIAQTKKLALEYARQIRDEAYLQELIDVHPDQRGSAKAVEGPARFLQNRVAGCYPGNG